MAVDNYSILPLSLQHTFALYIHIPFCVTKCPYCDFNSYALTKEHQPEKALEGEQQYVEALCSEMRSYANSSPWKNKSISSIFFGGGTPSLLQAKSIEQIISTTKECWSWCPEIEITLECNPGTLKESLAAQKLAAFKATGINRLSFGVQSIRPEKLTALGRLHCVEDVYNCLEAAHSTGFSRLSIDLMYGLPIETAQSWKSELEEILEFAPSHLSAYTLTIEPGTEFANRQRKGIVQQANEEFLAQMYISTQEQLAAKGYQQYEVSNFAYRAEECRHNLSYWRWESYLGLGAGAHSFIRREPSIPEMKSKRFSNIPKPSHYIERIENDKIATGLEETLDLTQEKLEVLYCFLRTRWGMPITHYDSFFGDSFSLNTGTALKQLLSEDLISYNPDALQLTKKGYLFSDYVLSELAAVISNDKNKNQSN